MAFRTTTPTVHMLRVQTGGEDTDTRWLTVHWHNFCGLAVSASVRMRIKAFVLPIFGKIISFWIRYQIQFFKILFGSVLHALLTEYAILVIRCPEHCSMVGHWRLATWPHHTSVERSTLAACQVSWSIMSRWQDKTEQKALCRMPCECYCKHLMLLILILASENWHKEQSDSSIWIPVVNEERMKLCHWHY